MPDDRPPTEVHSPRPTSFEESRRWLFVLLAVAAVACAMARSFGAETIDRDVLFFLVIAGAFLVLERVKKFSVSKDGISYEVADQIKQDLANVQKNVSEVKQMSAENQRALTGGVGGKRRTEATAQNLTRQRLTLPPPGSVDPEDPQKGRFGGTPMSNGRELCATVAPCHGYPGNYNVILEVASTDRSKPLQGKVIFYLHDSFSSPVRAIPVEDGIARLELLAYGAFTVGAVADEGDTLLELDLSKGERFPKAFREA